jgi:fumarate hydratase subunit beta
MLTDIRQQLSEKWNRMTEEKSLRPPLESKDLEKLTSGDKVVLNGKIYTARDAAHKRLIQLLEDGKPLPFDIKGQIIYYVGPTPEKPGEVIGSAGPTTSGRMDPYTPQLLDAGLKGMIGKGQRSKEVIDAIVRNKSVYFAATGGAGVLLAKSIKKSKIIAYEDLGPEAIREIYVENFPCIVAIDFKGIDLYEKGPEKYQNI